MPMKTSVSFHSSPKFLGLLSRRERWGLSWRGWLVVGAILVSSACLLMVEIQPFLAVTSKVHGQFLIVEGWIPPETLKYAMSEFKQGDYREILTSGCLVREYLNSDIKIT